MNKALAVECAWTAQKHVDSAAMRSSALLCLDDAVTLIEKGNYEYAFKRALKSLAYSVGIFHPDYSRLVANFNSVRLTSV